MSIIILNLIYNWCIFESIDFIVYHLYLNDGFYIHFFELFFFLLLLLSWLLLSLLLEEIPSPPSKFLWLLLKALCFSLERRICYHWLSCCWLGYLLFDLLSYEKKDLRPPPPPPGTAGASWLLKAATAAGYEDFLSSYWLRYC